MNTSFDCNLSVFRYLSFKINCFSKFTVSCHTLVGLQIIPELYLQEKPRDIALGPLLNGFLKRKQSQHIKRKTKQSSRCVVYSADYFHGLKTHFEFLHIHSVSCSVIKENSSTEKVCTMTLWSTHLAWSTNNCIPHWILRVFWISQASESWSSVNSWKVKGSKCPVFKSEWAFLFPLCHRPQT